MASVFVFVVISVLVVAAMAALALGTEYVVGDDQGWTTNVDYQAWAAGKEFHVGDKLIFKYKKREHDIHKVDETAFELCATSTDSEPLTSGNDVITLVTPGKKWYLCGVGSHCETGNQKFMINVTAAGSTIPPSAAIQFRQSKYLGIMITSFGLLSSQFSI